MEDSLETGFLFHTPAGPFNFFFNQAYRPIIFTYNITETKYLQNTCAHNYTNLFDHWAVQWSSTIMIMLLASIKSNNDCIPLRATWDLPFRFFDLQIWNKTDQKIFLLLNNSRSAFHLLWNLSLYLIFSIPLWGKLNLPHSWFPGWIRLLAALPKELPTSWISSLLHCTIDLACRLS